MIKFFRRLRRQLLSENRFSKYLIYAIGEIILVVVGILIALSINNWNTKRLAKLEEKVILENLLNEFETNHIDLKKAIANREKGLNANKELLELMNSDISHLSTQRLDSLIGISRYITTFEPKTGIIDGIINSGKTDLIENDDLRKMLSSWAGALEDLQTVEKDQSNIIISQYNPYLGKYLTLRNSNARALSVLFANTKQKWTKWHPDIYTSHKLDYQKLFSDPEFESLVSTLSIWRIGGFLRADELRIKIEDIITLIQKELK